MGFISKAINKYKIKKAKLEEIKLRFEHFVQHTRPLVPKAPRYPEAALYRYVWKRAVVLQHIYTRLLKDEEKANKYKIYQELAAKIYFSVAPENAYGKVNLKLSSEASSKMIEKELQRLFPDKKKKSDRKLHLACIYVGYDNKENKPYIGKTIGIPEHRWREHRLQGTGPFKNGALYANWEILAENVSIKELENLEAYYIGLYDAYDNGHNENRGNSWQDYDRGVQDR